MRVLLVEDDLMIGESVALALKDEGYATDWVQDGEAALTTLSCQQYDIVLLDIGLPLKNGLAVLKILREHSNFVPVLVITARDEIKDRITGLDLGADDYLVKPFSTSELFARMRALIRRNSGTARAWLGNGRISLDPSSHAVLVKNADRMEQEVSLSRREFSLLQALLSRPGAILSRSEIEDKIYGWGEEVESNAVEFLIHSLRKKVGKSAIKNVRGIGWMVSKEE